MDGLPIPENNPHLDYKSQTDFAHMCGHDGHMVTLISAAHVLQNNVDKIPQG
jgi:metal-dependent amidase/aminoacylase/carboxypeptidase family protein